MKKLIYIIFAVATITLVGCKKTTVPDEPRQVILMYMVANNSLEADLKRNIEQVLSGITRQFPKNGRVLIMFDGTDSTTLREVIPPRGNEKHATLKMLVNYGGLNSCDPAIMRQILRDVEFIAPADHYGIIMSSHGTGWYPKETNGHLSSPSAPSISGSHLQPEHDFGWLYNNTNPTTRSFGQDGYWSNAPSMSIPDIVAGLSPIHFDFVMFDACFMASIELIYALRNSTDYIISSPVEIMQAGFPYQNIMPLFFTPGKPLEERLMAVADGFVDYYNRADKLVIGERSAAVSVVKMAEMENFATAVRNIYTYEGKNEVDISQVKGLEKLFTHAFFDLTSYITLLCGSDELLAAYNEQYDRTVLLNLHTATIYSMTGTFSGEGLCGVSTYIPRPQYPITAGYWQATEWAQRITGGGE